MPSRFQPILPKSLQISFHCVQLNKPVILVHCQCRIYGFSSPKPDLKGPLMFIEFEIMINWLIKKSSPRSVSGPLMWKPVERQLIFVRMSGDSEKQKMTYFIKSGKSCHNNDVKDSLYFYFRSNCPSLTTISIYILQYSNTFIGITNKLKVWERINTHTFITLTTKVPADKLSLNYQGQYVQHVEK